MKLDLLTNATVVKDAIDLYRLTGSSNENDKEANEPDYNYDEDRLEEKQEEEAREITTNQVF